MKRTLYIDFSQTERLADADYTLKLVIRRAILATLDYEGFELPSRVSVTLTTPEYINKLNLKYRGVDKPTDVLSFPLYEDGDFTDAYLLGEAELGDIVISLERAREQAVELGHGFLREVAFLAVHSTLHLLGYDHERSPEDDEDQCRRQREIIEKIEI